MSRTPCPHDSTLCQCREVEQRNLLRLSALTVLQPWGSALFAGRPVESRTRKGGGCPYPQIKPGQTLAIHAGLKRHPWADAAYAALPNLPPLDDLPMGALIGTIHVVGWHAAFAALMRPHLAPWVFPGDPGRWYLEHDPTHAVLFHTPIPCSGAQGVWSVAKRLQE